MKAFKAYDIRGVYPQDFGKEEVYKIGFFLPELMNVRRILVGRDMRTSSPEIYSFLVQGILDAGADVYDIGMSTTPMLYWAGVAYDFSASVMITASHNPKQYNGLKISGKNAIPVSYETGLSTLERWIRERVIYKSKIPGEIHHLEVQQDYMAFQRQWLPEDFSNLKLAFDCSHGMASLFVRNLYGRRADCIHDVPDGNFPSHEANPLEEENRKDLVALVKEVRADVGIIFDGDADRVMFLDEKADFISPDLIIALLSYYFLDERQLRGKVLHDIRTSKCVTSWIERMGGEPVMWKVGRAFAAPKLREIDGIFGGELAGHYYFRDFNYSDSALMACSLVLGIVSRFKREGISLSQLIRNIAVSSNSGEMNFHVSDPKAAMEELKDFFMQEAYLKFYDFDGYRVEFQNWWFNVRPSNTEPYLRLIIEADTPAILQTRIRQAKDILAKWQF